MTQIDERRDASDDLEKLLSHVARQLGESDVICIQRVVETAAQGMRDVLTDSDETVVADLLRPIFEWSPFWTSEICHELIGEPPGLDYCNCEPSDWLAEFRRREGQGEDCETDAWIKEGF